MRSVFLVLGLLMHSMSLANEMAYAPLNSVTLTGTDAYNEGSYQLTATLKRVDSTTRLIGLRVKIDDTISDVGEQYLVSLADPDFTKFEAINDIGVFGSSFSFFLPYGDEVRCNRQESEKSQLVIHTSRDGQIADVFHARACEKR